MKKRGSRHQQPRWQFNAGGSFETPLSFGTLTLFANARRQTKFATGSTFVPAYTVVGGRAGINGLFGTKVDANLFVNNLFNR